MCGSDKVARKRVSVSLRNGRVVRDVMADVCPSCGERYFDPVAMDKIEAARLGSRSRKGSAVRRPR